MAMKIMWAAAIFFGGWLFFYLFGRQLVFNLTAAYPMIKKMREQDKELIAPGADKYTHISVLVCVVAIVIAAAIVIRFCPLYLSISCAVGAVSALLMYLPHAKVNDRGTFDLFCSAYSRFVPDDELRTAMFNRKPKDIRKRAREMGLDASFVPAFSD
ncbi:MAG: hypothetical protein IJI06_02860 [Oscillospiraceae bacterium]|nr:hypothetical protein [Oscillospiraceae bacterium]